MTPKQFNELSEDEQFEKLQQCCASDRWIRQMQKTLPWSDTGQIVSNSAAIWRDLQEDDFLQAFEAHPKIGNVNSLRDKYKNTSNLANNEQSGASSADEQTLQQLSVLNRDYENRFGYIFIVCATGKSAAEMLDILKQRMPNNVTDELAIAAEEQRKITEIRLKNLFKI